MSSFQFQADMYNSITPEEIQSYDKAYGNGYQDGHREGYDKGYDDAKAKYERPKGKWIRITKNTAPTQMWNCSECGRTVEKATVLDPDIFFPFCHCGADMRGD